VLLNPSLMNMTWLEIPARLSADVDYVTSFNTIYASGLTPTSVVDALTSFERPLLTSNSRFDRYLRGEQSALTAPEQHGYHLFKSYGCVACHRGIDIGGTCIRNLASWQIPAAWKSLQRWSTSGVMLCTRHDLLNLNDRLLWDIGISRTDAEQGASKPFWQI
jgi:cytochrome c peroxidase